MNAYFNLTTVKFRLSFIGIISLIAIILVGLVIFFSPNLFGFSDHKIRFPQIDTIGHFTSFFLLTWFVHSLLKVELGRTILTLLVYGGLTELGQHFLVYRQADFIDYLADVCGILFFAFVKLLYTLLKKKVSKAYLLKQENAKQKQANEA